MKVTISHNGIIFFLLNEKLPSLYLVGMIISTCVLTAKFGFRATSLLRGRIANPIVHVDFNKFYRFGVSEFRDVSNTELPSETRVSQRGIYFSYPPIRMGIVLV